MDQLRAQLMVHVRRHVRLLTGVAIVLLALLALLLDGCDTAPVRQAEATPPQIAEGGAPHSLDSALALFRRGLAPIADLEHGAESPDAIVARLVEALQRSDTTALREMVMSRREFAWLYYPTSAYTRAPTKQEPGLAWYLHTQHSEKGVTRLVNRFGGGPLRLANRCSEPPVVEGVNTLWFDCVQRIAQPAGDTLVIRLFGGIYGRNGRFKIFSYSSDL